MADLDPSRPRKEEDTESEGPVEIWRSAREIGCNKCQVQQHSRSMAGTRGAEAGFGPDCADHYHFQTRLQVCTFASTNAILSAQTETTALIQQVLTMLRQEPVQQHSHSLSLSMHSQVEPVGFNSQTTRVGHHPRLWVQANGYHSQVVANISTSIVTFSILSPDASLSYDRIKLRLEEYRTLIASDSDTIELSTENGKTVICRRQAKEMKQFLDQAEILLQDVVQSRNIPTLVVLHHLRDLAEVLDKLKLFDECLLTGNCALDLAEALGRRSLEFRQEQAETLALIAELSVYQPRARTLFTQAVSISEEVVANNTSHSSKYGLLMVLGAASYSASGQDYLGAQWLERAVRLMTRELPPTMVHPDFRGTIYNNYGNSLYRLKQYASAVVAYDEAISIRRILANNNPARHNFYLASERMNMGGALNASGKYGDAIACYKDALDICKAMSAQDQLQYDELMVKTLLAYSNALVKSSQLSEAVVVGKQAVSVCRNIAQAEDEHKKTLCDALHNYGDSCFSLGQHAESVLAYQESIHLRRDFAATDPEQDKHLGYSYHDIANSFRALGKYAEANAAASEALERNHGAVLDICNYAPDFKSCFVCQRAVVPDSLSNASASQPLLLANSSQPAEHSGADVSHIPTETPKPPGETVNVSVHKGRQKILGFFKRNRAR